VARLALLLEDRRDVFVNVGIFGASAAAAAAGSIIPTLSAHAPTATFRACPCFSDFMFVFPLYGF